MLFEFVGATAAAAEVVLVELLVVERTAAVVSDAIAGWLTAWLKFSDNSTKSAPFTFPS